MVFYSDGYDHYSHRVRLVLAEKNVAVEIRDIEPGAMPEDVAALNPYNSLPILEDRDDLVLYEPMIIMEYIDERFPHPPLLPVYPVERAQSRLLVYRVERDWCQQVNIIQGRRSKEPAIEKARKALREGLVSVAPVFADRPYFMHEDFSLVDCCIAPILWRLPLLGIELPPKHGKPILDYMERIFDRDGFQASLSDAELDMRD